MDVLRVEIAVRPAYRAGDAGWPYWPGGAGSGGTGPLALNWLALAADRSAAGKQRRTDRKDAGERRADPRSLVLRWMTMEIPGAGDSLAR